MKHELYIHVDEESADPKYIFIRDLSTYLSTFPPENRLLEVVVPGKASVVIVPFPKSRYNGYDGSLLGLPGGCQDLPDGSWAFTYSVAPNSKNYHKVYHFRTVVLRNKLAAAIAQSVINCENGIDDCGNVILDKKQNLLLHANLLINSATQLGKDVLTVDMAYKHYQKAESEINMALRINSNSYV